jgi:hypothetical protein
MTIEWLPPKAPEPERHDHEARKAVIALCIAVLLVHFAITKHLGIAGFGLAYVMIVVAVINGLTALRQRRSRGGRLL